MRIVVECLVVVAIVELLYFNLTAMPQQDYQHNNPYTYSWVRK